jgi:lycopene beta-cyclase
MKYNSTKEPIDLVIIGAGAAGLGLLLELNALDYPKTIKILERSSGPSNDRIWSFWYNAGLPRHIESIVTKKWHKWALSVDHKSHIMEDSFHQYASVRSEDFSRLALKQADKNPLTNVQFNCDVKSVETNADSFTLVTQQNEQIVARKIIDTRPPKLKDEHEGLVQCFYGEEIVVEKDIFDPSCVKLMEHLKVSDFGIEFVYILPFNKRHALIEFTCFNVYPIGKERLKDKLNEVIERLVKRNAFEVLRSENAVLPMYLIDENKSYKNKNMAYAGMAGGAMRASTGYSFLNCQQWAKDCAYELNKAGELTHIPPIHFIYRAMDKLMLSVIREDMNQGVRIFELMFEKVKPARFARFMTERATSFDIISVIWAMPKLPFVSALIRSLFTSKTGRAQSKKHDE